MFKKICNVKITHSFDTMDRDDLFKALENAGYRIVFDDDDWSKYLIVKEEEAIEDK